MTRRAARRHWKATSTISLVAIGTILSTSITSPTWASPNSFTVQGVSWVSVDESSKIYFEDFGQDHDDYSVFEVPAGITCLYNGVTKT